MDTIIEVENIESENPVLMFYDDVLLLGTYNGTQSATTGTWEFTIPASDTTGKQGLYWYCIYERENKPCLKKPIYFE